MKKYLTCLLAAILLIIAGCTDSTTYPFTETTGNISFSYNLPQEGIVDIFVLNCYMNNVRTIISNSTQTSGDHSAGWNLQDEDGQRVPDGLYFIRIFLDDNVISTEMYEVHR